MSCKSALLQRGRAWLLSTLQFSGSSIIMERFLPDAGQNFCRPADGCALLLIGPAQLPKRRMLISQMFTPIITLTAGAQAVRTSMVFRKLSSFPSRHRSSLPNPQSALRAGLIMDAVWEMSPDVQASGLQTVPFRRQNVGPSPVSRVSFFANQHRLCGTVIRTASCSASPPSIPSQPHFQ